MSVPLFLTSKNHRRQPVRVRLTRNAWSMLKTPPGKELFSHKSICKRKGFVVHAWHTGDEHIRLYLTIPPKYSASYAVAVIKGKTSAWIKKKTRKFPKGTLWNRGCFISTVGLNELVVKRYVENQRHHQKELAPLPLYPQA
jgi:hypothetical protein